MKILIVTILSFIMFGKGYSQTRLYEHPNFDALTKNHEKIAIAPFKTSITLRPKQMKELSKEDIYKMESDESISIQHAMYTWFLNRNKKGNWGVTFQDPATTNAKLKSAGITYDNYNDFTPKEVAEILGVDAIVTGTFETDKPMSEGASVALGMLVGFWGATNKATINLFIYNAADGETLVNYNKGISGSLGSNTDQLINVIMRKASRRIGYNKK